MTPVESENIECRCSVCKILMTKEDYIKNLGNCDNPDCTTYKINCLLNIKMRRFFR